MSKGPLYDYCKDPAKSTSRESTFRFRFLYEMKLAAARRGLDLKIYEADIDNDGSDVVLDDGDTIKKIQLKAMVSDGGRSAFEVHAGLLRPSMHVVEQLQFDPGTSNVGPEGAIVLQILDFVADEVKVSYWFTDIFVLYALMWNLIPYKRLNKDTALNLIQEVERSTLSTRISLPKSAFIEAKSPDHLLGLLGLHSTTAMGLPGILNILDYAEGTWKPGKTGNLTVHGPLVTEWYSSQTTGRCL